MARPLLARNTIPEVIFLTLQYFECFLHSSPGRKITRIFPSGLRTFIHKR